MNGVALNSNAARGTTWAAFFVSPAGWESPVTQNLECIHRGLVLRHETGDLCGRRGEAFAFHSCARHGECAVGRFCQNESVKSCVSCLDLELIQIELSTESTKTSTANDC